MNYKKIFGDFYSPLKALSYGRKKIFTIGIRSLGKSTGWAIWLLLEFLRFGKQFIYVRRTKDETDLTAPGYFDNAYIILKSCGIEMEELAYKGGTYYIGEKVAGYAIPLSLNQKYKSKTYSNVFYILYDEFTIEEGSGSRYLGGRGNSKAEVMAMDRLLFTVDRGIGNMSRGEVTIIFLGNAGSFFNPFFIEYGIDRLLRPDTKYLAPKKANYVLEYTAPEEAVKRLMANAEQYSEKTVNFAIQNKFLDLQGGAFIEKEPKGYRLPMFNFIYEGQKYGVYAYTKAGYLYVGHRYIEGRQDIALTTADHSPNYLLISRWSDHYMTKELKQMYDLGCIRFQDAKCKLVVDFYLKYDII